MTPTQTIATRPVGPSPGGPTAPGGPRPPTGHGALRRMVIAVLVTAVVVAGIATLSIEGARLHRPVRANPITVARADATAFLDRYLAKSGRVIRRDQGRDTVSEGQAYAMLLAVALGRRQQFASAWNWELHNLAMASGLFSYRWANGAVVGEQPATDADLETAWALVLGARRFGVPAYEAAAVRISSAVLADETATVKGRLELLAGPWAQRAPFVTDPSYLAPEAMAALASATADPRWSTLEANSQALLLGFLKGAPSRLPPDWADLAGSAATPVGAPSTAQGPVYGLDAQRVPVIYAASCQPGGRMVAAKEWPILRRTAIGGGAISYSLGGRRISRKVSPLGFVAAAAAADAAGNRSEAAALLDRASVQSSSFHTYYGDAWLALGRVLLDTAWLSPCPPSPVRSRAG